MTVTNVTNGHTLSMNSTNSVSVSVWNPDQNDSKRPLPCNISWKSENRVSKSKIEFPAPVSNLIIGPDNLWGRGSIELQVL